MGAVCHLYANHLFPDCVLCALCMHGVRVSFAFQLGVVGPPSAPRPRSVFASSGQHLRDLCATSLPHLRSVFAASGRGGSARLCLAARVGVTGRIRSDSLWIITPGGVMETLHWVKCPIEAE